MTLGRIAYLKRREMEMSSVPFKRASPAFGNGIRSSCYPWYQFGLLFSVLTVENYFQYTPNLGAAIFFACAFGLITLGTVVQSIRTRTAYMWVMAMGTTCTTPIDTALTLGMVIGFSFRARGHFDVTSFGIYLGNQLFIVRPLKMILIPGIGTNFLFSDELCYFWKNVTVYPWPRFYLCPLQIVLSTSCQSQRNIHWKWCHIFYRSGRWFGTCDKR